MTRSLPKPPAGWRGPGRGGIGRVAASLRRTPEPSVVVRPPDAGPYRTVELPPEEEDILRHPPEILWWRRLRCRLGFHGGRILIGRVEQYRAVHASHQTEGDERNLAKLVAGSTFVIAPCCEAGRRAAVRNCAANIVRDAADQARWQAMQYVRAAFAAASPPIPRPRRRVAKRASDRFADISAFVHDP